MSDFHQIYIDLEKRKEEIARALDHVPICGFSGPQRDGADREPQYARSDIIDTLAKYELGFCKPPRGAA